MHSLDHPLGSSRCQPKRTPRQFSDRARSNTRVSCLCRGVGSACLQSMLVGASARRRDDIPFKGRHACGIANPRGAQRAGSSGTAIAYTSAVTACRSNNRHVELKGRLPGPNAGVRCASHSVTQESEPPGGQAEQPVHDGVSGRHDRACSRTGIDAPDSRARRTGKVTGMVARSIVRPGAGLPGDRRRTGLQVPDARADREERVGGLGASHGLPSPSRPSPRRRG